MTNDSLPVPVSRETLADLQRYAALVTQWTRHINLIAKSDVPTLWQRHICDSAQLYSFVTAEPDAIWLDVGSGGGLPGVVLALLRRDRGDLGPMILVESDLRKATFLREVARQLSLPMKVLDRRIEELAPLQARVVTARALAPLDRLVPLLHPHMAADAEAILPKGRQASTEIAALRRHWTFELTEGPSITDREARILHLTNLARIA